MKLSEYVSCDALGLAELVRTRQVSAEELRETALRAIEQLNPRLNAVIGLTPVEADRALRERQPDAPFPGVPFLLKDIGSHMANVASELGSRFAKGLTPPSDTELAARFKRAGLVTLGRTNVPEFGCNVSTEPVLYGPTRNPWNVAHSAGGSSGGAAAAVAAGIVPLAHANDAGGSIRIPAACCGLFGLKPSRLRNPAGPEYDELIFGFGVEHVLTRTVRDSAAMLDAIHGADVGARYLLPAPQTSYRAACERDPGRLRIAYSVTAPEGAPEVDTVCREAVLDAARLCESLGHEVFEAAPPVSHDATCASLLNVFAAFMTASARELAQVLGWQVGAQDVEATTWAMLDHGARMSATDLALTLGTVNQVSRKLGRFFTECDLWLSPILTRPTEKLGVLDADEKCLDAAQCVRKIMDYAPFCAMFNGSGQPAMSVPLLHGDDGLPVGVQFAARFAQESTLFSLAGQLERARPWKERRPPVCGDKPLIRDGGLGLGQAAARSLTV